MTTPDTAEYDAGNQSPSAGIGSLVLFDEFEPEPVPEDYVEPQKWSERDMLDRLMKRYDVQVGNGHRFARAKHVRSHAGFDARRTADFIAMDLWPSKGLALHGHEVKVSRSDWLSELKDPTKADEFKRYMDRWWLVVPDARIVRDDLKHERVSQPRAGHGGRGHDDEPHGSCRPV